MKIIATYLIKKSVNSNFNTFEIGFFEGILAAFGIGDFATDNFASEFKSYTFITTKGIDENINSICAENGLHYMRGNVSIKLS